ncbi:MAG TPA: ATP-binding protein, partial [Thermoanaerobaculia bacterium]
MFYSVRARLTLWYTGILALVLVTFSGISYVLLVREIRASSDAALASTAHEFTAAFRADPSNGHSRDIALDFRYSDRDILVLTADGEIIASSHSQLTERDRQRIAENVRGGLTGYTTLPGGRDADGVRVFSTPMNVLGMTYIVVAARNLHEQTERFESVGRALFLAIPLALIVAAGGGYLMARKSLAPVATMSLKARHIGAETLTERITVSNRNDELGVLAATLNDLLERLQRAFESQRGFMADASHELRTPLAIIQGEADVVLSRYDRTAAEYRESIAIIQTAARKLTRIVESLFLLARSDAGRYPITRTRFYLDEMLADSVKAMRSVAAARNVDLAYTSPPELMIEGDEALLHRMTLNLIDNALKFTPAGGKVRVDVQPFDDHYLIRVIDTGIGVTEGDRSRIFERFYRGERVRSLRGTSSAVSTGAGLGLPIARWIAEAHGGEL